MTHSPPPTPHSPLPTPQTGTNPHAAQAMSLGALGKSLWRKGVPTYYKEFWALKNGFWYGYV
jgi:hypothetical protein